MNDLYVKNLNRQFGEKSVLTDISFNISKGEKVLLTGKNGSGKSTLLRILATLLAPTKGTVKLGMYDLNSHYEHAREQISWVPCSERGFVQRFTGLENLQYYSLLYDVNRNIISKLIHELSDIEPLQLALKTPFFLCSSGMKQSLNIARGLIKQSPFIFLDEPFRNLDAFSKRLYLNYLSELSSSTIIISTHDILGVDNNFKRTIHINGGEVK